MTLRDTRMPAAPPTRQPSVWPLIVAILLALAYGVSQAGPAFSGELRGSDDMMRLQQVRDLIAGQNWFDVDQARLYTPEGGAMHWSRLPDIFLASIILLTQPLIGREMAEGLAVTLWPLMQLTWVLTAIAACLRRLGAPLSGQLAGLFFFCTSAAMVHFLPGRIDHHGLGIALTITALACLISPRMTIRSAAIAAACVAAMITLAMENLPVAGLIIAGFGTAWIIRGTGEAARLRVFGGTLIIASLIAYVFDAPGAGGLRGVCDAYGQSHFVALLVAGAGMAAIATIMPGNQDWRARLFAMALAGGVTLFSFMLINPDCIASPYAALPEDVQSGWLDIVSEARPFTTVIASDPGMALIFYGVGVAGLASAIIGLLLRERQHRLPHAALLALLSTGIVLMAWQLRATALVHALSAIASGWLFGYLFSRWLHRRGTGPALVLLAGAILISPTGWTYARKLLPIAPQPTSAASADCRTKDAYREIVAAPRMIVFTPVDLGAPLIYFTRNYATAAPYHRNPAAIELTVNVFTGPAEDARAGIAASGATHIAFCPGLGELKAYAKAAPEGLAADLVEGRIPRWLTPLTQAQSVENGPVVYTISFDRN